MAGLTKFFFLTLFATITVSLTASAQLQEQGPNKGSFHGAPNAEIAQDLQEKSKILDAEFAKLVLSEDERMALKLQSAGLHAAVNQALRTTDTEVLKKHTAHICAVDKATHMMSLKGMTLYRGHNYLGPDGTQVGAFVSDLAFSSTSLAEHTAFRFSSKRSPHVVDVIDTSGTAVSGIWMDPVSFMQDEYEFLLARNIRHQITKIETRFIEDREYIVRYMTPVAPIESSANDQILNCSR